MSLCKSRVKLSFLKDNWDTGEGGRKKRSKLEISIQIVEGSTITFLCLKNKASLLCNLIVAGGLRLHQKTMIFDLFHKKRMAFRH